MLLLLAFALFPSREWDWLAIEIIVKSNPRKFKKCRHQIGVRGGKRHFVARCDARTTRNERNVDVFLNVASLSRWQSMLANVVAVVRSVEEISVGQYVRVCLQS